LAHVFWKGTRRVGTGIQHVENHTMGKISGLNVGQRNVPFFQIQLKLMQMAVIAPDGFLGQVTEFAVEQKKTDGFAEFGTRSRRIGHDLLCLPGWHE
jgi:hypothetical protein